MMCGDQYPQWTREDILAFTEPKLGYTRESPGFIRFVNVLADMNGEKALSRYRRVENTRIYFAAVIPTTQEWPKFSHVQRITVTA